jgi:GTPase SAR1 family protein
MCFLFVLSRGAQGALLVYDVGRRDSFEHVQNWYSRARQLGGEHLETVLIGNKSDLSLTDRQVSTEEGDALAKELGMPFVETSALSGSNVENAFVTMTLNVKKSVDRRGLSGVKSKNMLSSGGVQLSSKEKKSGCC